MKVRLMSRTADFDPKADLPAEAPTLAQDLGLDIVWAAMAGGDRYLREVVRTGLITNLASVEDIRYRQAVLADCLANPDAVRGLYALAVEAIEAERKVWGYAFRDPDSLLRRSVDVLGTLVPFMGRVRDVAETSRHAFASAGFSRLFDEVVRELDDAYLASVNAHLERLRFQGGVTLSAGLGQGNRGTGYVLRRRTRPRSWRERIGLTEPDTYTWRLPDRDESGATALRELRGRGIALAAGALGRSTHHIVSYFGQLRAELGFYVGCLNLHDQLAARGQPISLPDAEPPGRAALRARGLYDVALCLSLGEGRVVGNDVDADGANLLVITGANRGGKSTFLRSLGLAQLMMQAGMFVGAVSLSTDVRDGIFTHFRREEDATLESGKLDEELRRLSGMVERVKPGSLILFNESFASTNEREGSEIGSQITRAFLEAGVKVAYVTHMYHLADGLRRVHRPDARFLRAERLPDGRRTFRVVEGDPLPTSHGVDVYRTVFGADPTTVPGAPAPSTS